MSSCSSLARQMGEPLAGSAPTTALWLALEQPGAWGARAPADSQLESDVAHWLSARAGGLPLRVVLIRRPGRHPDVGPAGPRTLLLARPGTQPQLRRIMLARARDVLDLDLEQLVSSPALPGPADDASVLLVCTNGRRDVCCAVNGRDAAARLRLEGRHEVWESTHLGGHRFSPTVLQLPDGWLFGGPGAVSISTDACRGRTDLTPSAQAAELAVLAARGITTPRALAVDTLPDNRFAVDGTLVRVHQRGVGADRPQSCGGLPRPAVARVAELI